MVYGRMSGTATEVDTRADSGCASRYFNRFFYEPKANRGERDRGLADFDERAANEISGREAGAVGALNCRSGKTGSARNVHPTVKPISLLRWLVRLITPPGGVCLDPFCGSGSHGIATLLEGFRFIGIELNDTEKEPFVRIARARMEHVLDERPVEEKRPRFGKASQGRLF